MFVANELIVVSDIIYFQYHSKTTLFKILFGIGLNNPNHPVGDAVKSPATSYPSLYVKPC